MIKTTAQQLRDHIENNLALDESLILKAATELEQAHRNATHLHTTLVELLEFLEQHENQFMRLLLPTRDALRAVVKEGP